MQFFSYLGASADMTASSSYSLPETNNSIKIEGVLSVLIIPNVTDLIKQSFVLVDT